MGADGHVLTFPVVRVPAEYLDLLDDVERLTGWRRRTLHGSEEFLWSYWSTEGSETSGSSIVTVLRELQSLERLQLRPPFSGRPMEELRERQRLCYLGRIEDAGGRKRAERAEEFELYLQANGQDWQVWT